MTRIFRDTGQLSRMQTVSLSKFKFPLSVNLSCKCVYRFLCGIPAIIPAYIQPFLFFCSVTFKCTVRLPKYAEASIILFRCSDAFKSSCAGYCTFRACLRSRSLRGPYVHVLIRQGRDCVWGAFALLDSTACQFLYTRVIVLALVHGVDVTQNLSICVRTVQLPRMCTTISLSHTWKNVRFLDSSTR
jgi:hypothetical protein